MACSNPEDFIEIACLTELALAAQENLNQKLHPEWRAQNYPFHQAIWREAAEVFMHTPWEWWRHEDYDGDRVDDHSRAQVALELCDILHFGLSMELASGVSHTSIGRGFAQALQNVQVTQNQGLTYHVEQLAGKALTGYGFNRTQFLAAVYSLDMGFREMFALYFGKAALNEFRWANGYMDKTYHKNWATDQFVPPAQDNVYLEQAIKLYFSAPPEDFATAVINGSFRAAIMGRLGHWYRQHLTLGKWDASTVVVPY